MGRRSIETIETDILVIGGGAAACMAAIAARGEGARVVIVDKGQLGKSGCSPNAHGGMAVYYKHPRDGPRVHLEDTLMSGGFLNDQRLVAVLCAEGAKFLARLEEFGCLFDREADGRFSVRQFGGHRYSRSVHSGDETGHELMNGLKREVLRLEIPVLNEVMSLRLATAGGAVTGAVCLDLATGRLMAIASGSTVLATADAGGIWPAASERQRGDGVVQALDAGAEVTDMEFIQYHPTHAWWPYGVRGSVSEGFRSEGGWLLNGERERFMARYDPDKMELATRDKVSVAIIKEIRAGRGAPHGGIFASVAHLPPDVVAERLRVIFRKYLSYGIDVRRQPVEVRPRPHYHCGGVVIDPSGRTTVPGLYAAGAVTAGVHGANRLGSNSLVDILVFGERAGLAAAAEARSRKPAVPGDLLASEQRRLAALLDPRADGLPTAPLRRRHIEAMDEHVGVLRTGAGLQQMLDEIARARREDLPRLRVFDRSQTYNFELVDALEMSYRVEIEEMATRAALLRTESRGTHFREDYPERNDRDWLVNVVFARAQGELRPEVRPVTTPLLRLEDLPEYAASRSPWH